MSISKKLCAVFAIVMTAATVWLFAGCSTDGMKDVSERRSAFFTASDDVFTVTAVSGVREKNYVTDGVAGELKSYTLITVVPRKFDVDAVLTYKATTKNGEFGGALTMHPFAASFSAEFDSETSGGTPTVTVESGGVKREYTLTSCVQKNTITYDRAIEAAEKAVELPRGKREIRVRLIRNPIGGEGLCWHVAYYYADGKDRGVLIDPVTAKPLAVKK